MAERHRASDIDEDEEEFLREFGARIAQVQARYSQCPGIDAIQAASAGTLSDTATAIAAQHVAQCGWCSALAADLAIVDRPAFPRGVERRIRARVFAGSSTAARPWMTSTSTSWRVVVPLAAAAGLVLAVVLIQDARRPAPQSGAASPSRQEAAPSEARQTGSTAQPLTVLRLEKPAVRLPLAAAMTWRGEPDRDRARFADEFKAAMSFYRADDYAAAADRLGTMAREFPGSPDVWFYLGVSHLLHGTSREAIASLDNARRLTKGDRVHEVSWYLALAYQRDGDMQKATETLGELCRGRNPYSAQACTGMQELKAQAGGKGGGR